MLLMKFKIAKSLQDYLLLPLYETAINLNIQVFDRIRIFFSRVPTHLLIFIEMGENSGENSSSDYGIGETASPRFTPLAQTGFRQPSLFGTRVLAHWIARRSSYSRRSNGQGKQERKKDRDPRDLPEQRARTLRHVAAGGTTSGYRKCQKAQSSTALVPSFPLSSPLPLVPVLALFVSLCARKLTAI